MVDKKRIAKSTDLAGGKKDKGKKDEPTKLKIQDEGLAAMVEAASAGKEHVQTFETPATGKPHNVYKEITPEGPFMWWTIGDGQEVGRETLKSTSEATQQSSVQGYRFMIPFDAKIAEKLRDLGGRTVKFLRKEGNSRTQMSFEEFVKSE